MAQYLNGRPLSLMCDNHFECNNSMIWVLQLLWDDLIKTVWNLRIEKNELTGSIINTSGDWQGLHGRN